MSDLKKRTVLLVEDEPITAVLEKRMLEKNDYSVVIAETGEKAVELVKANPEIDLILMDIDLGSGIDGTEAAEIILKDHDLPVVFLSSHTEPEVVEKTEGITSYGYIVKNSGETVLMVSIKMAFRLHDARSKEQDFVNKLLLHSEILNQIEDKVTVTDLEGNITYVNNSEARALGKESSEMVGQNIKEFGENKLEGATQEHILSETIDKGHWAGDVVNFTTEGKMIYYWCRTKLIHDKDKQPIAICGISTDMTEKKMYEQNIKESEKKFRQISESIDEVFWLGNKDNIEILYISPAYEKIWGRSCQSLYENPQSFLDSVYEEDKPGVIAEFENYSNGQNFNLEYRIVRPDGTIRWIRARSFPVKDKTGNFVLTSGVASDITEIMQTKKSLEDGQKRLAGIIEGSRAGTWEWNVQSGETVFNERWAEIIGYSLDEIRTINIETWKQFVHPEDLKKRSKLLEKHFNGKLDYYEFESRMKHKNGEWIWVLDRGKVISWTNKGKPLLMLGTYQDITKQKKLEKKLKVSQERLDMAMMVKNEGIWDWDLTSNKTLFDDRYYTMAGYRPGEFPQNFSGWSDRVHIEDLPKCQSAIKAYLNGETDDYNVEFRFKHKNGSWLWISGIGRIVEWDKEGNPVRFVGTHTDITERKRAEDALRESEARFKSIIAVSNTGAWEYHRDRDYLWCSPEYFSMLGRKSGDFTMDGSANLAESWIDLIHPDDRERASSHFAAYLSGGSLGMYENYFRMKHKDGNWVWIWSRGQTLRDIEGKITDCTVGTHIDITERKQAEESLRESEAKLSALFASMTEMVVLHELVFDESGKPVNYRITDCNTAFTRITGIRYEDSVGRLASEVYETPDPPYLSEFSRVALTGEPYDYETYYPPMDKHFAISVVSPGKNRFATITTDITEAKRVQTLIDAKNKELEQLVYVASHDLRSPLVNVDGYSRELSYSLKELISLLEEPGKIERLEETLRSELPDMEKSISRIISSTRQMDNLLRGLLKISRLGQAAINIKDIDVNECINQLTSSFAFILKETSLKLTVEKLPACQGDVVQLTQVFANLIDNAIKYQNPERPGKIKISGSIEMDRAVYRVEDNGIGIAENHLQYIFELFHRLEPGKTKGEGLGLSIVRQSLSRMNGEIRVESKLGEGSVFIVSLPPARRRKKSEVF